MARHRDLHDRILSLFAMRPYPIGVDEVIEQLEIESWQAHRALAALHVCGAAVRHRAPLRGKDGGQGRPAYLWSLPSVKPVSDELYALLRQFPIDTVVVTPSNREARIKKIDEQGFADLAYLDGDPDGPPLRLTLLKAFQPGRERPQPYRVKA
jgi:hypothetical protein